MNVFLTGASSGIGAALATLYAAGGATLGLFARREAELERIAAALAPAEVLTYAGDVREAAALSAAAGGFIARVGVPDIVIASAGHARGRCGPQDRARDLAQEALLRIAVADEFGGAGTEDRASAAL